ncbi:MAG: hypothetical protein ACKVWV_15050 [Planctomycetota bacterium]
MTSHSRTRPACRSVSFPALVLCLSVASCASVERSADERLNDLIVHGQFEEAVHFADEHRRQNPGSSKAETMHRGASVAYLLDQGRRLTLDDRDEDALAVFHRAREMDPALPETAMWIDKTNRKLATTWSDRGMECFARQELDAALESYENALRYVPGDLNAINGVAAAVLQLNFRAGLNKKYFKEGLQALSQHWLEQARSRFSYSTKYDEKDERAKQRRAQTDRLLSAQRVTIAKALEADGNFAAASNEFRLALALDPENGDAREGRERTKQEARAAEKLRDADMAVLRGRFDDADRMLTEGAAMSVVQADVFRGAREQLVTARHDRMYEEAIALERDFLFSEAVAKYTDLLEITQYYKDVITRKETLEGYIQLADELYAKAAAAGSSEEKVDLLRQIEVFWPEYKDIQDQLRGVR